MTADPRAAEQVFQQAQVAHRAGQYGVAESHYRRVVKLAPRHADAWHLLGIVAMQQDRAALAIRHLRTAVELRPDFAQAWNNLGIAYKSEGDLVAALAAAERALSLRPAYFEARFNLGLLHDACGDRVAAESAYREALRVRPEHVGALTNLGNLLRANARYAESAPLLEHAHTSQPDADTTVNLALLRIDQGRYSEARELAGGALQVPAHAQSARAWLALGVAARMQQDTQAAVDALRHSLRLEPGDVTTAIELALALHDNGNFEEGCTRLEALASQWPESTRLQWLAALALPAIASDEEEVRSSRASFDEGLTQLERDTRLDTPARIAAAFEAAGSVVPFHLNYQPQDNSELQRRFGALVSRCVIAATPELAGSCEWQPLAHGGRARIGFVSPHLYAHSVARFFGSLVTHIDRSQFETHVWHLGEATDAESRRIAAGVDRFDHRFAPPLQVAREIRSAELDALVLLDVGLDPAMQVLGSLRLAPVQCVAYGHPVSTGLPNVDFFLSGELLEGKDAQRDYSETLVRLPGIGALPQRPPSGGDGTWLERYGDDLPWLLCLQNPLKLSPDFDELLVHVLSTERVRLGVFAVSPAIADRWRQRIGRKLLAAGGDTDSRLHLLAPVSHADLVAGIAQAALVLDTPHFSGGSTSLDAIAAATPIVAFAGARLRANQTSAMLRLLGAPELVAADAGEYLDIVNRLLVDHVERGRLSEILRSNASRLFEDRAPVTGFEAFLATATARNARDNATDRVESNFSPSLNPREAGP